MATTQTANAILEAVFARVIEASPESTELAVAKDIFDAMTRTTPNKPVGLFLAAFGPHASLIFAKNPAVFDHLELRSYWDALADSSKQIVWLALGQVYLLALAISTLPNDTLAAMESTARSFADEFKKSCLTRC